MANIASSHLRCGSTNEPMNPVKRPLTHTKSPPRCVCGRQSPPQWRPLAAAPPAARRREWEREVGCVGAAAPIAWPKSRPCPVARQHASAQRAAVLAPHSRAGSQHRRHCTAQPGEGSTAANWPARLACAPLRWVFILCRDPKNPKLARPTRVRTSPLGVKTNTDWPSRSSVTHSTNSEAGEAAQTAVHSVKACCWISWLGRDAVAAPCHPQKSCRLLH